MICIRHTFMVGLELHVRLFSHYYNDVLFLYLYKYVTYKLIILASGGVLCILTGPKMRSTIFPVLKVQLCTEPHRRIS